MLHYLSEWHHFVYGILTILFFVVYVIHFLPIGKLGRLKAILESETILMLVLIFVAVIASRVEHVAENADNRWNQANTLLEKLSAREGFEEVKKIENTSSIFRELSEALNRAEHEVLATSFRPDTPKDHSEYSGPGAQWYADLDQWTHARSGRSHLRLIGLSNESKREWFAKECKDSSTLKSMVFRGLEWDDDMPFVNMVIFDDDELFLLFRSDPNLIEQTIRYRIKGPEMVNLYREKFKAMWAIAKECKDF